MKEIHSDDIRILENNNNNIILIKIYTKRHMNIYKHANVLNYTYYQHLKFLKHQTSGLTNMPEKCVL